jgi:single-strand DNA-binding protein
MQKLIITGNLGADAVVRAVTESRDVINMNVAVTEKWKDAAGTPQQQTTWYNCSYFRPKGQTVVAQYLKKGGRVMIVGKPSAHVFTDKQGTTHAQIDVNVNELELLSGAGAADALTPAAAPVQTATNTTPAVGPFAPQEDDLPF